jgi:cellobiose-specific phosphotransferase system component IIA
LARNPKSLENLKKFDSNQSREQAKINGSKGGKACQKARRERKTQREQLELLMSLPFRIPKAKQQIIDMGVDESDINNQMAMNVAMLNLILKGGKGAVQAYNSFNEMLGECEKKELELEKARQEIEKLKLEQKKILLSLGEDNSDTINDNIISIVELINNPYKNRDIEDME